MWRSKATTMAGRSQLMRPPSEAGSTKTEDGDGFWSNPLGSFKNMLTPPRKLSQRDRAALEQAKDILASEAQYLTEAWVANRALAKQEEAVLMEPWGAAQPWKSNEPQSMLMYCHAHVKDMFGGIQPVTEQDDQEGLGPGV